MNVDKQKIEKLQQQNKQLSDLLSNIAHIMDEYINTGALHELDALDMIENLFRNAKETKRKEQHLRFQTNLNEGVKVKLTKIGVETLKERHEELSLHIQKHGGEGLEDFTLNLDEDGYYHTQLWKLMSDFGDKLHIGSNTPFGLDIVIENGKLC